MSQDFEIITVDASNLAQRGFFCYMSKPKSPGYRQKRLWLQARFAEGMKIKIIHEVGGREEAVLAQRVHRIKPGAAVLPTAGASLLGRASAILPYGLGGASGSLWTRA